MYLPLKTVPEMRCDYTIRFDSILYVQLVYHTSVIVQHAFEVRCDFQVCLYTAYAHLYHNCCYRTLRNVTLVLFLSSKTVEVLDCLPGYKKTTSVGHPSCRFIVRLWIPCTSWRCDCTRTSQPVRAEAEGMSITAIVFCIFIYLKVAFSLPRYSIFHVNPTLIFKVDQEDQRHFKTRLKSSLSRN